MVPAVPQGAATIVPSPVPVPHLAARPQGQGSVPGTMAHVPEPPALLRLLRPGQAGATVQPHNLLCQQPGAMEWGLAGTHSSPRHPDPQSLSWASIPHLRTLLSLLLGTHPSSQDISGSSHSQYMSTHSHPQDTPRIVVPLSLVLVTPRSSSPLSWAPMPRPRTISWSPSTVLHT